MSKFNWIAPVLALVGLSVSGFAADNAKMNDMASALKSACKADVDRFCKDITPGEGRVAACLKSHSDKLSSSCTKEWKSAKAEMKEGAKGHMRAFKQACNNDVQKFCSNSVGIQEISSCLKQHDTDLSASCKNYQANMRSKMESSSTG